MIIKKENSMNGKMWMEHFEKQSPEKLKKLQSALYVVLSDPALKREYGEGAGLDTIRFFIERVLEEKKGKKR